MPGRKWYSGCNVPLSLSPMLSTPVSGAQAVTEESTRAWGPAQHQSAGDDHAVLAPEAGTF